MREKKRKNVISFAIYHLWNDQDLFLPKGEGHQGHPVIDYKVSVSRNKKPTASSNNERVMAAGLSKMLRRFSIDTAGSHNKVNKSNFNQEIMD